MMRIIISNGMRGLLCLLLLISTSLAGEDCGQYGGRCRDVCSADEVAANGAFLDCADRQECCIEKQEKTDKKPVPKQDKSTEKNNEK